MARHVPRVQIRLNFKEEECARDRFCWVLGGSIGISLHHEMAISGK